MEMVVKAEDFGKLTDFLEEKALFCFKCFGKINNYLFHKKSNNIINKMHT